MADLTRKITIGREKLLLKAVLANVLWLLIGYKLQIVPRIVKSALPLVSRLQVSKKKYRPSSPTRLYPSSRPSKFLPLNLDQMQPVKRYHVLGLGNSQLGAAYARSWPRIRGWFRRNSSLQNLCPLVNKPRSWTRPCVIHPRP